MTTIDDVDFSVLHRKPLSKVLEPAAHTEHKQPQCTDDTASNGNTSEVIELVKAFYRQEKRSIYTHRLRQIGIRPREFKGDEWFAEYKGSRR